MAAKREEKVTLEQKEYLVSFMELNIDFARGKLLSVEGRLTAIAMWEMLVQQLNAMGPEKDVKKWQRMWTQLKTKVKRKASELSAGRQKTGGGPPTETPLTDIEEKVIFIMSKEGVYGLEGPDGVSLESDVPSVDINAPSTSRQSCWVAQAESLEVPATDSDDLFSPDLSISESLEPAAAEDATTPLQTPQSKKKGKKASDSIGELMQQNEDTNSKIGCLVQEMGEIKETLKEILDVKKREVNVLERIANALENKK